MPKSLSARIFVALIIVSGFLLMGDAVLNVHSVAMVRFVALLVLATVAARLKVKLPGLTGTMSVNLPFFLLAAALLGTAEAMIVGFISTLAQCLPRERQKLNLVQLAFNSFAIAMTVGVARLIYVSPIVESRIASQALRLALAAAVYFLANTVTMALVISLTEQVSAVRVWKEMFQLSYVYLVASAGVAGLALTLGSDIGWQVLVALLLVMSGVFYSYRRYFAVIVPAAKVMAVTQAETMAAGANV
jgi:hypothetical protein